MNYLKVHGTIFIALCITVVGIASNVLNLPGSGDKSLGARYSLVATFILFFFVLAIYSQTNQRKSTTRITFSKLLIAGFWPIGLLGLQAIALMRTALTQAALSSEATYFLLILLIFVGIYWLASQYFYASKRSGGYWRYLAWSVIVLALVSISLKFIGLSGNNPEGSIDDFLPSVTLGYFGIDAYRSSMPLFSGLNIAGVVFGAAVCCSAVFTIADKKIWKMPLSLCVLITVIIGLLWIDTRGAVLAVAISLFLVLPWKIKRTIFLVFMLVLLGILVLTDTHINIESLARPGTDLSSSRLILWGAAISDLIDPKLVHLIGYGAWGQYVSGVSGAFFELFSEESYETASLHNATLQVIFDSGYVGLVFFIVTWCYLIRHFWRQHVNELSDSSAIKLVLVIYIFVSGQFESFYGYSNAASMFIYVGVLVGFITDITYQKCVVVKISKSIKQT